MLHVLQLRNSYEERFPVSWADCFFCCGFAVLGSEFPGGDSIKLFSEPLLSSSGIFLNFRMIFLHFDLPVESALLIILRHSEVVLSSIAFISFLFSCQYIGGLACVFLIPCSWSKESNSNGTWGKLWICFILLFHLDWICLHLFVLLGLSRFPLFFPLWFRDCVPCL